MATSCNTPGKSDLMLAEARYLMESGMFTKLLELSGSQDGESNSDPVVKREIDSLADYACRYMNDFRLTRNELVELLRSDSVYADEDKLREWEEAGHLEFMWIDGERKYFRWAHRNLYRINDSLRAIMHIDRQRDEALAGLCLDQILNVTELTAGSGYGTPVLPKMMNIKYTITVEADAVPAGEVIRCWMPFPREKSPRQDRVILVGSDPPEYLISPDTMKHRSVYLEKAAVEGEPAIFSISLEFRSWGQHFNTEELAADKNVDVPSELAGYTQERLPHISFSDEVRQLASSLVTFDMGPFEKVRAFYRWINDNIIWTSALEYSLMPDIPAYVLQNGRGDCGMQTLLFLSLCRYAGVPAKWQSGWMMHPGHVNLHDWSEVWTGQAGWVPVDVSFKLQPSVIPAISEFYISGIDSYRFLVNDDYGRQLYPPKHFPRSEPVDFQRGELEWERGNIYFDSWVYNMQVEYQ